MILHVEDDPLFARSLRRVLRTRGLAAETAACGAEALRRTRHRSYELVLLDLGLPDAKRLDVLRALRARVSAPLVVLSGSADNELRAEALDAGADDYIDKADPPALVLARVAAHLRRARTLVSTSGVPSPAPPTVTVDPRLEIVLVNGQRLQPHETRLQLAILSCLARQRGRLVRRERLVEEVWGKGWKVSRVAVHVHMTRLRSKLAAASGCLVTKSGGWLLR